MAGNTVRTYRNTVTDEVHEYPEALAAVFDFLVLEPESSETEDAAVEDSENTDQADSAGEATE